MAHLLPSFVPALSVNNCVHYTISLSVKQMPSALLWTVRVEQIFIITDILDIRPYEFYDFADKKMSVSWGFSIHGQKSIRLLQNLHFTDKWKVRETKKSLYTDKKIQYQYKSSPHRAEKQGPQQFPVYTYRRFFRATSVRW